MTTTCLQAYRAIAVCCLAISADTLNAGDWQPLKDDGIHDSANPALKVLQNPAEALSVLPPDTAGNNVDWVRALRNGDIKPVASTNPDTKVQILDLDVIMTETGPLAYVLFPHNPHSEWMSCENCHEQLFISKIGSNPINMGKILNGEYCGRCHGAVAFPLTECNRCHSVARANSPAGSAVKRSDGGDK